MGCGISIGGLRGLIMGDRNDEQRQALRLRRSLMGGVGRLAFVVWAWTARAVHQVGVRAAGCWLLYGPWLLGCAVLLALTSNGRNQGCKNPRLKEAAAHTASGPVSVVGGNAS